MPAKNLKSRYTKMVQAVEDGMSRSLRQTRPKVRRLQKRVLRAERRAEKVLAKRWDSTRPVLQRRLQRVRKGLKVATS